MAGENTVSHGAICMVTTAEYNSPMATWFVLSDSLLGLTEL